MCGIVGSFNISFQGDLKIRRASQAIRHRGPDGYGYWEEGGINLGHRRLSIIDLSDDAGQPMTSFNKDVVIVFNGEIYNYLDLKIELENKGYLFQTKSDTEVVLASYQEWGYQAFERFNGMFSFTIFDKNKDRLIVVRDHAGIKPLYYSFQNNSFIFCSEVRGFEVYDPNWQKNPNWDVLFLTFGFIPKPYTTLKDVLSLSKGSYLIIDTLTGKFEKKRYNQFVFDSVINNEKDAIELVRSTVLESISRNMISDAPLGIFLSGGIDSSLIALLADSMGYKDLTTLSVTFKERSFDESPYQKIIIDKMRPHRHIDHNVGANDFIENIDDIFDAMDQPSCDSINSYFVSKAAHDNNLKAVLSGLGADELFGGYPSFNRIKTLEKISKIPNFLLRAMEHFPNEKVSRLAYLGSNSQYGEYLFLRGGMSPSLTSKIVGLPKEEIYNILSNLEIEEHPKAYDKNLAAFLETNIYMENQLLKDIDYMSMWNSLEVRVPFLDKELLGLMHTISPSVKFHGKIPKYLLVKAFEDILPKEVVYRKKQGFTFPFSIWLKQHIEFFKPMLPDTPVAHKILHQFLEGKVHWSRLWSLIVYNQFKK